MPPILLDILRIGWFIIGPVMLLVGLGFLVQKKFRLDMPTLVRMNFYIVVPGIVYFAVVDSALSGPDVVKMVGFTLCAMLIWGALAYGVAKLRGVPVDQRRAMMMTSLFYNSGNVGLPVQELAFRNAAFGSSAAMGLQVIVLVTQNLTSFTLGIVLASGKLSGRWRENLTHIVKFPPLYAITAALLTVFIRRSLGDQAETVSAVVRPVWDAVTYAKNGFIVVALVTLGAQLAVVDRGEGQGPVALSVLLRLVMGPVVGFTLLMLLGWKGPLAQVLLISTSMPTAVNCMLLCLEFDNHPAYVARCVFYATLLSPITVTLTILLARSGVLAS